MLPKDQPIKASQKFFKNKDTIRRCVKKIKNYTQIKTIDDFSTQQLEAIDDHGSKYSQDKHINYAQTFLESQYFQYRQQNFNLKSLVMKLVAGLKKNRINSVKPSNPLIIVWNLLKFLLVIHILYIFPLSDAFGHEIEEFLDLQNGFYIVELCILIVDLLMRFNVQIYGDGGVLITRQKEIIIQYLKSGFIVDFGVIVGFIFFMIYETGYVKYLCFMKIPELNKFFKYVRSELDPQQRFKNYLLLIKLFLTVIILAHLIACVWIAVGKIIEQNNWIIARGLIDRHWFELYLNALYYAIATMTTVGYGDISAQNVYEVAVAICAILSSSFVFAYVLNTITTILKDLDHDQSQYKHDLRKMQSYLIKKGIGGDLKKKVEKYKFYQKSFLSHLKLAWKEGPSASEQRVFKQLSANLQKEIEQQDKGSMLLKIPFLAKYFSLDFLKESSSYVQEINYQPSEPVSLGQGIYIVYKGALQLAANFASRQQYLCSLQQGDYGGINSIFMLDLGKQKYKIISERFSIIYYLSKDNFLKALKNQDLEKFHYIKDRYLRNNNDLLDMKCQLCHSVGHEPCQQLSYHPNKELILAKYLYTEEATRKLFQRKRKRSRIFKNLKRIEASVNLLFRQGRKTIAHISEESDESYTSSSQSVDLDKHLMEENKNPIELIYRQRSGSPVRTNLHKRTSIITILSQLAYTQKNALFDQYEIIEGFEVMKKYKNYYPQFNYDQVLKNISLIRKKKLRPYYKQEDKYVPSP